MTQSVLPLQEMCRSLLWVLLTQWATAACSSIIFARHISSLRPLSPSDISERRNFVKLLNSGYSVRKTHNEILLAIFWCMTLTWGQPNFVNTRGVMGAHLFRLTITSSGLCPNPLPPAEGSASKTASSFNNNETTRCCPFSTKNFQCHLFNGIIYIFFKKLTLETPSELQIMFILKSDTIITYKKKVISVQTDQKNGHSSTKTLQRHSF